MPNTVPQGYPGQTIIQEGSYHVTKELKVWNGSEFIDVATIEDIESLASGVSNAELDTNPTDPELSAFNTFNLVGGAGVYEHFLSAPDTPIELTSQQVPPTAKKAWQVYRTQPTGYWTLKEVPVDLSGYALSGGSSKTLQDVDVDVQENKDKTSVLVNAKARGWALPVTDSENNLLGGWKDDGRFYSQFWDASRNIPGDALKDMDLSVNKFNSELLDKIALNVLSNSNSVLGRPFYTWPARVNSAGYFLTAASYLRSDNIVDVSAYNINASLIAFTDTDNPLDTTKTIVVEWETNIDTAKNNGALIGFVTGDQTSGVGRFLVGYEPAHTAIEIYNEATGQFYKIIDAPANGAYKFKLVLNSPTSLDIYINGTKYEASDYTSVSITATYLRVNAKIATLGLTVKNLNQYYLQAGSLEGSGYKKFSTRGATSGRQVHIYEFGGLGNDWCFVRTPASYTPDGKAFPFVICSHGNGWNMDGSQKKASWTDITMYLPADDPDYIANPSRYTLLPADHPEYYTSNPTIEAFLAAGYIVCGCQNYADALYGNNNCRNAAQDFFNHMRQSFNVEEKCFLIGASNGAMTSLNLMHLLGISKIKGMILQYGLTCLWRHYTNYPLHQAGIESAYGISSGLNEDQFDSATRTHDPEKVNTIILATDRVKTTALPPMKFWYSDDDPVCDPNNNSKALIEVLDNSNAYSEFAEVSGGHGDVSHFDPSAYVAFFNKFK